MFFVICSDADAGTNSELTYSLISGDVDAFLINPNTGAISSKKLFDRETKASYTLTVRARDHGQTPLEDTATVDITILDINDNSPQITNLPTTQKVSENKKPGDSVFSVTATDKDTGQ